jgi:phosphohistidine phosphatase
MKLYLIQHGKSVSKEEDPQRPLNEEGRICTQRIGQFLKSKNIKVDSMWHSSKLRSIQTAQILSGFITTTKIMERQDLNPLDPVDKFPQEIDNLNKDLIIVGHLPFLQKLTSLLLVGSQELDLVSFVYSGVVCLEKKENWKLAWFLVPQII